MANNSTYQFITTTTTTDHQNPIHPVYESQPTHHHNNSIIEPVTMTTNRYHELRKLLPIANQSPVSIKCRCGTEVRRVTVHNVPTLDELSFLVQRLFKTTLSSNLNNLILKYIDEDSDLVSITDDIDINHAIALSTKLNLVVFDRETLPFPKTSQTNSNLLLTSLLKNPLMSLNSLELRLELTQLTTKLDQLLDHLTTKDINSLSNGQQHQSQHRHRASSTLTSADLEEFVKPTTTIIPPPQPTLTSNDLPQNPPHLTSNHPTVSTSNHPGYPPLSQPPSHGITLSNYPPVCGANPPPGQAMSTAPYGITPSPYPPVCGANSPPGQTMSTGSHGSAPPPPVNPPTAHHHHQPSQGGYPPSSNPPPHHPPPHHQHSHPPHHPHPPPSRPPSAPYPHPHYNQPPPYPAHPYPSAPRPPY